MRKPSNRMSARPTGHRCMRCRLIAADCLCDLIPRIETRTQLILILHQLEDYKPSNTGRLAHLCLPNSTLIIRGGRGVPCTSDVRWTAHGDPVLLFPHADALPLEAWRSHARPITLIVPDGTWRQAQRVRRRVAGLAELPCAFVSRASPSSYRLRRTSDARRLSTMEAIAEALGTLEGPDGPAVRDGLLRVFDTMVERSLRVRSPGTPVSSGQSAPARLPPSGDVDFGIEHPGEHTTALRR
jgi:DTW domain-containing protein YfiP